MAKEAKYEILVPKTDHMGNPLVDLSSHALHHITKSLQLNHAHIESNRRVHWNGKEEPFDALVFHSEDHPHVDSHAKQLAAYLGEVANQDVVVVSKQGANGIQTWPVANNQFNPAAPADSYMLAPNARGATEAAPPGIP